MNICSIFPDSGSFSGFCMASKCLDEQGCNINIGNWKETTFWLIIGSTRMILWVVYPFLCGQNSALFIFLVAIWIFLWKFDNPCDYNYQNYTFMQELTIVIWPIYDILCLKCGVDTLKQQNLVMIISPTCVQNKTRNSV